MISVMKAERLLKKGCIGYLASVIDVSIEQKVKLDDVPIVRDFLEVFPEDLLGLPPDREIKFVIELVPSTTPISQAPYRMALAKLKELKHSYRNFWTKSLSDLVIHRGELQYCL